MEARPETFGDSVKKLGLFVFSLWAVVIGLIGMAASLFVIWVIVDAMLK